ncbi:MAG TPA: outer membrane protein assembly factor BamA [Stellaceae bacterium]|nr:outer membrane protein assembly factor BamA [Stellaceae bacterium]
MREVLARAVFRAAAAATVAVVASAPVPLRAQTSPPPTPAPGPGQPPARATPRPAAPAVAPGKPPANAPQQQTGGRVSEIRVEGTERIEPETIRSYLLIQPGDPFDADRIDRSLKALFATGLFADVSIKREGDALVVHVVENPIINRIAFEGNKKLNDQQLLTEVQLKPRTVFTRTKVQSDVKRILDLYRRNGRFAASVDPKVIQLPQNRVDLVFEIDEGASTGIKRISFIGAHEFSPSRLKEVIQTRESRWYRFFSSDDIYDPDRITYDRELLRKFYLSEGYADFRVVSAVAELAPSRDGFYLTYTIEEGERYKFGTVDLVNQLKDINPDELKAYLTMRPGDRYNADQVEATITALTDALGNRGYAFVDIQPRVTRHADTHTIDITFDVKEGPRVYVERINIAGNVRTLDKVIRREFRLVEGDAFNAARLRRSQQRIRNLGFFKKVDVTTDPGSAPDKTVINVNVEEQSTGEFSIGVGFSTTDGPLADVSIRERNLLGRGQDLRLGFTIAQRLTQLDFSFTQPYFLDRNMTAGVDLFALKRDEQQQSQFDQDSVGGALRAGYQITESLRQTLKYTLRRDDITNVASSASIYIKQSEGARTTSAVGQVLLYDRRDNRQDPTAGYFAQLSTDLAGLGGTVRYFRTIVNTGYYYSIAPQWVVSVTGEGGYIVGINQAVEIEDRFFIGGDNLRGFATGGIGPRDAVTRDALGGNLYYVGSISLGFPLGLPQEIGLTGRVFTDFGMAAKIDQVPVQTNPILDTYKIRASAGVGVSWNSPLGPIRLDVAEPFAKASFDKKELFRVSFGTRF